MISYSKRSLIVVGLMALVTLGQSCSVSVGNTKPKDGGIYRTDDQGKTWRQKSYIRTEKKKKLSLDDATINFLVIDPKNPDRLYAGIRNLGLWMTSNRGEQWAATGLRSGNNRCLTFDPKNDQILYLANGSQIQKSTDQAKTWVNIYTEPQAKQSIECLAVDPARDNILWAVTSGGKVIRSSDYGGEWTLVNTLRNFSGIIRMDLDPITSGPIIFSSRRGIRRLDASGVQVTDLTAPLEMYKGGKTVADVEIVNSSQVTSWYLATAYGILTSGDSGTSWRQISTLLNPNSTPVTNIVVNPKNISEIYLTTGKRLHRTTDGGASWAVTTLPTSRQPVWLTIDGSNPDRLYFGTYIPIKKK